MTNTSDQHQQQTPSEQQTFTLHYFAAAQSYTRRASEQLPAPLSLKSLFTTLEGRYPGITERVLSSCAVTVNLEYVDVESEGESGGEEVVIQIGDEIAIIPPVSSG